MGSCPSCARELPGEFPFCPFCGSRIEAAPAPNLERKVVTALFCDLVGSTAAAEGADPEDVRRRLGRFHQLVRSRLESFGGTVEKFAGDAALAVFGAPVAHEDDAERAVRAGLAILDELAALNEREPTAGLHVRIGVNTGESVVDLAASSGQGDAFVFGDVVNTAARLQSAAPVDAVAVGESTRRATDRVVEYEALDPVAAKGKSEPLAMFRAVRARSRVGVDVIREVASPMVGRADELDSLLAAFDRCCAEPRVELVTVVGDPGVGKSRLVAELFAHTDARPELITWRQGRCLPYGDGITYWALGEIVKAQAGIDDADDVEVATAKLDRIVPVGDDHERLVSRALPLLGIEGAAASPVDSHRAWRELLEHVASTGPLVVVLEDLHWADDALLAFLEALVAESARVPMLVVGTARPGLLERHPGWTDGAARRSTVRLDRLSDDDTARLVSTLLDQVLLPAETQSAILERAAGNPLYAEEFVRLLRDGDHIDERGALRAGVEVRVPDGIQALITARLDALDPRDKTVLQAAAVVGKVFSADEVGGLLAQEPAGLAQVLERLHRYEYVRAARRTSGDAALEYSFWHVLVRDVAYGGLARSARARMHAAFAEWLAARTDRPEDVAEIAAHHAEEALALAEALGDLDLAERMRESVRAQSLLAGQHLLRLDVEAAERYLARSHDLTPPGHQSWVLAQSLYARALFCSHRFSECCETAEPVWDAVHERLDLLDSVDVYGCVIDFRNAASRANGGWDPDPVGLFQRYLDSRTAASAGSVAVLGYLANNLVLGNDGRLAEAVEMADEASRLSRELRCWSSMSEITAAYGRAMLGRSDAYRELQERLRTSRDTEDPTYVVISGSWGVSAAEHWKGPAQALELRDELLDYERVRHLDIASTMTSCLRALTCLGRVDEALQEVRSHGWDANPPRFLVDEILWLSVLTGVPSPPARAEAIEVVALDDELPEESIFRWQLEGSLGLRTVLAFADLLAGDTASAASWMSAVRPTELARLRNFAHDTTRAGRVWSSFGEVDQVRELAQRVSRLTPFEALNAETLDAIALEAEGRHQLAADAFAAVASRWRDFDYLLEETYAVLAEGRCRAAVGDPRGVAALHRAREMASRMGAVAIVRDCDAELARAERASS